MVRRKRRSRQRYRAKKYGFTRGISDPATLTYVVQIIAGVFIAGGVAVGVYWRKIKKLFSKDKTSVKKHESTEQERNAAAAAAEEFNEDK